MASVNAVSTLTGLFKEVYGSSVIDLAKFQAKLSSRIKFAEAEAIGNKFHQPVNVKLEHAFSYAASGSTPSLATVNTGQLQDAQVDGSQLVGRSTVDYESIAKSMNGDKAAFIQATKHVVKNLSNSAVKRLEVQLLHGRSGIGKVSSLAAEAGTYTTVITLTDATWSPGIWAGMVGATLDFYSSAGGTWRNVASAVRVTCTITAIDTVNKTVTISYGTARASWTSTLAANDIIFFQSATGGTSGTEFMGIDQISRNTGSMMNIDAATYELWAGNVYGTATGVLSMAKILDAVSIPASFGLADDVLCIVSPKNFEVLNNDLAALRMYDSSYSGAKAESGSETLKFHGQTGIIEVLPHPFQKDGSVHIVPPARMKRIGATDLTFIRRHGTSEALILETADTASAEMRVYSHQALFIEAPRETVVMDGVTFV